MASDTATNRAVGRRLAEARIRAGMSQAQLGAAIGVSGPRISHFESGHAFPPATHHRAIADALHVNARELFGELAAELPRERLPRRKRRAEPTEPIDRPRRQSRSPAAEQAMIANQILRLLDGMDLNRQRIALGLIRVLNRGQL